MKTKIVALAICPRCNDEVTELEFYSGICTACYDEKRLIRREWINYILQQKYFMGIYSPSLREIVDFVRVMEK